ncbi:MAG: ssDNA-binding replication factor A large subunit [Halobacteriales archaeon]|jgi:ssDNA-binding replication factor A large subunit
MSEDDSDLQDVYDDLEADISREAFREAVADKVEQMGGLADQETAAMLVAHELEDGGAGGEVDAIADVEPGMEEVKFLGKVTRIGELRTFDRDGEDEEGCVVNLEVADQTGSIRCAFWDDAARNAVDEIDIGDVLRIKGRPKEGYSGVEINVDRAEGDQDADIDVHVQDTYAIEDLSLGLSDVNCRGLVLDVETVRTFDRDDGSEGRVANLVIGDETGRVRVTLWDDMADRATEIEPETTVEVVDGYVRERDGDLELHVGDRGAVEELEETIEYDPDAVPIQDVEIGQTVDLAGVVRAVDPKRTFERDDGSEGQVRNVRIQDESGDMRVALWGDKADIDVGPGDEVALADVEIQDGWQDDLEASAGWRSSVTILEDGDGTGTTQADRSRDSGSSSTENQGGNTGLDGFSESGSASGSTGPDDTGESGSETGRGEGESVEFVGTVVQAGNPVVLDDGEETLSVETDADLHLGQEVTVRGMLKEGRLDADDVETP